MIQNAHVAKLKINCLPRLLLAWERASLFGAATVEIKQLCRSKAEGELDTFKALLYRSAC